MITLDNDPKRDFGCFAPISDWRWWIQHGSISCVELMKRSVLSLEEMPIESMLEMEVHLGKEVVGRLSDEFLEEHHGKYLAITYSSKILALASALEELNEHLARANPKENYYVCRIGYTSLGRIE